MKTTHSRYRVHEHGQAMTELTIILPLFLMLSFGVMSVVYICWQGIKVQQAANMAARIEGQERVAGGPSADAIQEENGANQADQVPDSASAQQLMSNPNALSQLHGHPTHLSVYSKFRQYVLDQFNPREQEKLFVPAPLTGKVGISDQVQVIRTMAPPSMFGFHINPVVVTGTAYGGEDTDMYALPRWGCVGTSANCNTQAPVYLDYLQQTGKSITDH